MSTSLFYSTKNEQELCEIIASFLSSYHNEEEKQQISEHLMELFNSGKSGEFVISCCKELNAVCDKAKDKDVESVYFILMEVVKKLGATEEAKEVCLEMCDILFSSTMATPLKAKLLSLILNSMPSFKSCRAALLQKIIKFAHESKLLEEFYKFLLNQDNSDWNDVMADYRKVLLSLHETLTSMKREKEAYLCLLKLVSTYLPSDPEYSHYAVECAVTQLKHLILDEDTRAKEQAVFAGLKDIDLHLFDLLHVVNRGDIGSLQTFVQEHPEVLSEHELDGETLLKHCRILAFTKLCSGKQQMSYQEIAEHLMVPVSEAEQYVVDVVKSGLVEGKMDQIKGEFVVSRVQCLIVDGEWENMLEKVIQWKENVQFILDSCDSYTIQG